MFRANFVPQTVRFGTTGTCLTAVDSLGHIWIVLVRCAQILKCIPQRDALLTMDSDLNKISGGRECIYCGETKPISDFSLEHIWPDALGGDYLTGLWQTNDVCKRCNSISGVFVDGAFIKSFAVSCERSADALDYLEGNQNTGTVTLSYLGILQNIPTSEREVIDYWAMPGANIMHFRDKGEEIWESYAGGDPRRSSKRSRAGRVIVSLTSADPFWIVTSLRSVMQHFPKSERFITNLELPSSARNFQELDASNIKHEADLAAVQEFDRLSKAGNGVKATVPINLNMDGRFMAKLALGVGHQLFASNFMASSYAKELRRAFREADLDKRANLKVRGTGYYGVGEPTKTDAKLRWPGGWQLTLVCTNDALVLRVTAPTGRSMFVQVTDDQKLLDTLDHVFLEGQTWITVPTAKKAVGPISFPDYLAHQIGSMTLSELNQLESFRGDSSKLPKLN